MNFGDTNSLIAVLLLLLFVRYEVAIPKLAFDSEMRGFYEHRFAIQLTQAVVPLSSAGCLNEATGEPAMKSVFLSYRRSDSADITGRIFDHLSARFGKGRVFRDVDSIPAGVDYPTTLRNAVQSCSALVAIIGAGWLEAKSDGKLRLVDSNDWVRIELEAALERDIPVIPALVDNVALPEPSRLPPALGGLAFRQSIRIRPDPDFSTDIQRLASALEGYLGTVAQDSELQRTFRFAIEIKPVSHGRHLDLGEPHGTVYAGGCKFRITLVNAGTTPLVVTSMKLASRWQQMDAPALERVQVLYKGVMLPHQLFVHLKRDGFSGWWLLSRGDTVSEQRRPFDHLASDLFQAESQPALMFQIKPGESEVIDGTIQPEDDGIYEVRLSALATNGRFERSAKATKPIRILKASFR